MSVAIVVLALHVVLGWLLIHPKPLSTPAIPTTDGFAARGSDMARSNAPIDVHPRSAVNPYRRAVQDLGAIPADAAPARAWADSPDPSIREAWAAGQRFERISRQSMGKLVRDALGDVYADALTLPPDEAWQRLESLLAEGDGRAASALELLAEGCDDPMQPIRPKMQGIAGYLGRDLPATDAAFIAGAFDAEATTREAYAQTCASPGFGIDRLRALLVGRGVTLPADATDADIKHRFGDAFGGNAFLPDDPYLALLMGLGRGNEPPPRAEVEALLAREPDNPNALSWYAICLVYGCPGMAPATPESRASWMRSAAELGNETAIQDLTGQARNRGDNEAAYAWMRFERWLMLHGCTLSPTPIQYAGNVSAANRLLAGMTPTGRISAERAARELIAAHGQTARTVQRCAD